MRKTSSLLLAFALLLDFSPPINASPLLDTESIATDAVILTEQPYQPYSRGNEVYLPRVSK